MVNISVHLKSRMALQQKALVVLGPYMPAAERSRLLKRGAAIPAIEVIEFDNHMEELIFGAAAVVAMGGYNTYCEILSFDKPGLIVLCSASERRSAAHPNRIASHPRFFPADRHDP